MIDTSAPSHSAFPAAPLPARLHISSNRGCELFLVDGNLRLAANGVGDLDATVPAGAYKIRAIRAGVQREELILAEPGSAHNIDFRIEGLETTGPSASVLGGGTKEFEQAIMALNRERGLDDPELQPAYFFASAAPDSSGSLFRGVRVFPWRQTDKAIALSKLRNQSLTAGARRWEIARIDLVPGPHVLELPAGERRVRIVFPIQDGAETHVSLRQWSGRSFLNKVDLWQEVAIQLRKEMGSMLSQGVSQYFNLFADFMVDSVELEQSARVALADGRILTLSDEHIYHLLHLKFDDPIMGLIAAHLMFNAIDLRAVRARRERALGTLENVSFSESLVETVLRNLSGLFGKYDYESELPPQNSDLVSLFLRAGRSWHKPFVMSVPPLFWRSWETLMDPRNAAAVSIEPKLWSETKFHQACGPYFSWGPQRMSTKSFINQYAPDAGKGFMTSNPIGPPVLDAYSREFLSSSFAQQMSQRAAASIDSVALQPAESGPTRSPANESLLRGTQSDSEVDFFGPTRREILRTTADHLGVPANVFNSLV